MFLHFICSLLIKNHYEIRVTTLDVLSVFHAIALLIPLCIAMDLINKFIAKVRNRISFSVSNQGRFSCCHEQFLCHKYQCQQFFSQPWHKGCFKCNECKKGLDSRNMTEAPDKEIYCKTCYSKM